MKSKLVKLICIQIPRGVCICQYIGQWAGVNLITAPVKNIHQPISQLADVYLLAKMKYGIGFIMVMDAQFRKRSSMWR